jgi:hypothetical protein
MTGVRSLSSAIGARAPSLVSMIRLVSAMPLGRRPVPRRRRHLEPALDQLPEGALGGDSPVHLGQEGAHGPVGVALGAFEGTRLVPSPLRGRVAPDVDPELPAVLAALSDVTLHGAYPPVGDLAQTVVVRCTSVAIRVADRPFPTRLMGFQGAHLQIYGSPNGIRTRVSTLRGAPRTRLPPATIRERPDRQPF